MGVPQAAYSIHKAAEWSPLLFPEHRPTFLFFASRDSILRQGFLEDSICNQKATDWPPFLFGLRVILC